MLWFSASPSTSTTCVTLTTAFTVFADFCLSLTQKLLTSTTFNRLDVWPTQEPLRWHQRVLWLPFVICVPTTQAPAAWQRSTWNIIPTRHGYSKVIPPVARSVICLPEVVITWHVLSNTVIRQRFRSPVLSLCEGKGMAVGPLNVRTRFPVSASN